MHKLPKDMVDKVFGTCYLNPPQFLVVLFGERSNVSLEGTWYECAIGGCWVGYPKSHTCRVQRGIWGVSSDRVARADSSVFASKIWHAVVAQLLNT